MLGLHCFQEAQEFCAWTETALWCLAPMVGRAWLQERDEELRKLRAAEESALPAADDDRLAASFEGVLKLTVQEGKEMVLTPEQVCCWCRSLQSAPVSSPPQLRTE